MRSIGRAGALTAAAVVAGVSTLFLVPAPAYAAPFQNGSFETPALPANSAVAYCNGATTITGWVVGAGATNCVNHNHVWPVAQGSQDVDLEGNVAAPGSISQTFDTTPGTAYVITFAYGANPQDGSPVARTFNVTVTGAPGANQNFSRSPIGTTNPNYTNGGVTFTAAGPSSTVTFTDTTPTPTVFGPVIDDVRLLVDPNGSILNWKVGLGVAGLVAGGYALYRVRRRPCLAA